MQIEPTLVVAQRATTALDPLSWLWVRIWCLEIQDFGGCWLIVEQIQGFSTQLRIKIEPKSKLHLDQIELISRRAKKIIAFDHDWHHHHHHHHHHEGALLMSS
ncbi:unnamed protein product [Citrullus colocynthis]|uniref:Uncharacterized protein n=1 Tax=Citrullus colocynthis TaxID=252529 RepID=A0ABP0YVI9_9ROSI